MSCSPLVDLKPVRGRPTVREIARKRGVATWDGDETSDALVARDDVALYAATAAGRDHMVTAELAADPTMAHIV